MPISFKDLIKQLKSDNLFNEQKVVSSEISSKVKIDNKSYINLASNNYLGLASNPKIKKAAISSIKKYGVGPAAVRTISGTTSLHVKLEKKLKEFKKTKNVITFQSGYSANTAVIPAVTDKDSIIYSDELNHASIIDGCRLSSANVVRYKHADMKDLKKKLMKRKNVSNKLIVTDGVFSMDGDIAPLDEIRKLAKKYSAMIMVDDAHGEGVLGDNGRGIVDHFGLHGKIDLEIGTLSKAFGVVGGYAAGDKDIIDWLRQRARPFLFSSAMTIPDTAASIKAVEILQKSDKLVKKLWKNSDFLKKSLKSEGFDIGNSQTPITPLMIKDEEPTQKLSKLAYKKGVLATAITYPTVPMGTSRIRLMPSAAHTKKDLKEAVEIISESAKKLKVINK